MKVNKEAKILYHLLILFTLFVILGLSIFRDDSSQQGLTGAAIGVQIPETNYGASANNSTEINAGAEDISEVPVASVKEQLPSSAKVDVDKYTADISRSKAISSVSEKATITVFGGAENTTISSSNIPNPWTYGVNLTDLQFYFRDTLVSNQAIQFQLQYRGNTRSINYQLQDAENTNAIVEGNRITYPEVFSGVNITYTVHPHRLVKNIFIANASSMRNFTFKIQFEGVNYIKTGVGSINFFDEVTGDQLFTIDAPFAWDSSVNESNTSQPLPRNPAVYYDVRQAGINYFIDLIVNETNMSSFIYPVWIDPTTQTGCGTLSTAGETYVLNQNIVATSTCFTIGASHITLDGAGFNITSNGTGFGIDNSGGYDNLSIINFGGINNFTEGALFSGMTNSIIWNNSILVANVSNSFGIDMVLGSYVNISNNVIIMPGSSSFGLEVQSSNHNSIISNNITTTGLTTMAIRLNNGDNNSIYSNNLTTYSSTSSGIIFISTSANNTIQSNNIRTSGSTATGILFSSAGGGNTILSNNITTLGGSSAHGIRATDGTGEQNITLNTITTSASNSFGISLETTTSSYLILSNTITAIASNARGVSTSRANYHILQDNLINMTGSSSPGIQIDSDSNHTLMISNRIITNTTGSDGIFLRLGINNTIVNGSISTTGTPSNNIQVTNGTATITNVSFDKEIGFSTGAAGSVTVQWYLDVNVTHQGDGSLENANVTTYNISSVSVDSQLTAANGAIDRVTLTEFFKNRTTTIYHTPHSVNGSLTGYGDNSTTLNITQTNSTSITLILPDTTTPNITLRSPNYNSNFSIRSSNQTFNVSVFDATAVDAVYFTFDNGTGTDFNITATNQSGEWSVSYNISTLAEEKQGVRIVANDTINNVNDTFVINFTVDYTRPNVTRNFLNNPVDNSNFSIRSSNQTFNASVFENLLLVDTVYFWFDNGTGKDFNITGTNRSGQWSVSYNVSALAEEKQGVRIIANDTVNNVNNTFVINFTVDLTAPRVMFTSPSAGATLTGTQSFNATLDDNLTAVQTVIFQFSNTTSFNRTASNSSGTWNVSVDTTTIEEGALIVTVFANDTLGNMNNTQTLSLTIDNFADAGAGAGASGGGGGSSSVVTSGAVIEKEEQEEEVPEKAPEVVEEISEKPSGEETLSEIPEEEITLEESIFARLRGYLSSEKLANAAGRATGLLQNSIREHPGAYTGFVAFIMVVVLVGGGLLYVLRRQRKRTYEKTRKFAEKNRVEINLLKEALPRLQKQRKLYKIRKKDTNIIEQNIQRKKKRLKELQGR